MPETGGIRYGLLCHGLVAPAWVERALNALDEVPEAELGLVLVVDPSKPTASPSRWGGDGRGSRFDSWSLLRALLARRRSPATRFVDLTGRLDDVPRVNLVPDPGRDPRGWTGMAAAEKVQDEELDFVLSVLDRPARGSVLDVPPFGIWEFRSGDPERGRVRPPGLWEIYRGDPVTRGALVRLDPGGGEERVLHAGCFRTVDDSWVQNRDQLLLGWSGWPARVCREIASGSRTPGRTDPGRPPPAGTDGGRRDRPTALQAARLLAVLGRNYVRNLWRELVRHEIWSIGLVDAPLETATEGLIPGDIRWLPPAGDSRYLADPFGLVRGDRLRILAEEYDHGEKIGRLVVVEPGGRGGDLEGRVRGPDEAPSVIPLEGMPDRPSLHASYPFLLEEEGEVYCVPETAAAGCVRLYRAVDFPVRWEAVATLVDDFPGLDATLFRHRDRWWLFCTEMAADGGNNRLHAWFSTALRGPWTPHALNPLKTDVRSARPAGTPFVRDGVLIRPAQDCSTTYGGSIVLNRIDRLTPTEFSERPLTRLRPEPNGPFPRGLHTISRVGDRMLVDGKRYAFVASAFRSYAGARLRSLLGRRAPGPAPKAKDEETAQEPGEAPGPSRPASPLSRSRPGRETDRSGAA